jgi:hypothetical protein
MLLTYGSYLLLALPSWKKCNCGIILWDKKFSLKETLSHFLHFIGVQSVKVNFHKYFLKLKFNASLFGLWVPYIPPNKKYHHYFNH